MNKKIYYLLITFVFSLFFFVRCTDDYTTFEESNKDHNHTNEKLNNLLNYLNLNSEEELKEHLSDFISNDFKLNIDFHKITETKNKDGILDKVALYAEDIDSSNNVFYNVVFVKKNDEIITYLVSFTLDENSETRRFVTKVEKSNNKRQFRCGGNEYYTIEVFSCPAGHGSNCDISGCCNGCWRLVGQGFTPPEECDNPFPFDGSGDGGGSNGGSPNYSPEYLRLNNMILEMNVKFGYKLTQPQWDNFHNYPAILTKFHSSVMNSEYSNATYLWAIAFLYDNVSAANYFNQNPQDLNIIFYADIDFNNTEEVDFVNTSTNTIVDILINNKNNTLSNLDYSWPNLDILKSKVRNAISKGIYTTAKYTRDYLYTPMVKVGNKYPSTIYWSNKGIDKIRLETVKPMVNFNENTMNWGDLFNIWLFELTPNMYINNNIKFTNSSNIINGNNLYNPSTNAVKNFPKGNSSGQELNIKSKLANGLRVGETANGYFRYDVNAFYSTISNSNIGIQMLGSFPITAKVISISGRSAVVQFHIYNYLGWESGTRFIKGQNGGGNQGVIDDKNVGEGLHLGGTIKNDFTWTETINF